MTHIFNDKFIAYLVLICGLSVSSVAVYYSVVGLAAIFAAAVIPVVIMGTVLEISKLAATVWLKQYWLIAPRLIKLYLIIAVLVLMLITSMGIFGFLSRAHIEQTMGTTENSAQIQRITNEIARQNDSITKNETRIRQIESGSTGQDATLQSQIDREQSRIDSAAQRVEPAIQEQNAIIASRTKIYQDQIDNIDRELSRLQSNLNSNQIAQVQSQVGVQSDGQIGPRTQAAIREYRDRLTVQKTQAVKNLETANSDPVIDAARKEIVRIRGTVESQIKESNQLINRLRDQLGRRQTSDVDQQIDSLRTAISSANTEIEQLSARKFELESEVRKLEAEVGPIKYLAKLIYGENTDKDILEKAVTWVIIALIFVFDPLAVILLLSSQISFQSFVGRKDSTKDEYDFSDAVKGAVLDSEPWISQEENTAAEQSYLKKPWVWGVKNSTVPIQTPTPPNSENMVSVEAKAETNLDANTQDQLDESLEEKEATRIWKQLYPNTTLKDQRDKLVEGLIDKLPWQDLITPLYVEEFGATLPNGRTTGALFMLTDTQPTELYKYTGSKWVKIDTANKNYYSLGSEYIDWLIGQLEQNKYNPDHLNDTERNSIAQRLQTLQ